MNDVSYTVSGVEIWTIFLLPYPTSFKKLGPDGRAGSIIAHDVTLF